MRFVFNKKLNGTFLFLFLFMGVFLFQPQMVLSQSEGEEASESAGITEELESQTKAFSGKEGANIEAEDPRIVVARIIKWALTLLGIVALAYTIYGGYLIMTAAGNEEKVTKGKNTLLTAVIGIAVILSAYGITAFISDYLLYNIQKDESYFKIEKQPGEPQEGPGDLKPQERPKRTDIEF